MNKPRLSFWQIWNMSFGFLGIQFGFALQNANVSRIFETLGASIESIPILWIAAPVTGLLVQPIIGYYSDRTWNRLGRRRPYFLGGALCASAALVFMPNSPYLWVAAGMLWIMDASINVSMEPFRAFVGDMLPPEQRTAGFAMQSFFIGTGAVVASALPYLLTKVFGVANTAPEGAIPPSVRLSFYLGAAVFLIAVLWTVVSTKEYSPGELEAMSTGADVPGSEARAAEEARRASAAADLPAKRMKHAPFFLLGGAAVALLVYLFGLEKELYVLGFGFVAFALLQIVSAQLSKGGNRGGLVAIMDDLSLMPHTMKQLAVVQFFSWFALFAMWIYSTPAVTSHLYDMGLDRPTVAALGEQAGRLDGAIDDGDLQPIRQALAGYQADLDAGANSVTASVRIVKFFLAEERLEGLPAATRERLVTIQQAYNDGADWVGIAFAVYNGFAAAVAFLLPVLAKRISRRGAHAVSLVVGGLALASVYILPGPGWLLLSMVGVGLAWASILALPYAMLAGALPADKMGVYMGIFNFFIVLPQILAATILGFLTRHLFGGEAVLALVLGGASWILAALLTLNVDDVDEKAEKTAG
jgi:maltose/moltooligosaccharide transporter